MRCPQLHPARAHQVEDDQPLVQRQVHICDDVADRHFEGRLAHRVLVETVPELLLVHRRLINTPGSSVTAMQADKARHANAMPEEPRLPYNGGPLRDRDGAVSPSGPCCPNGRHDRCPDLDRCWTMVSASAWLPRRQPFHFVGGFTMAWASRIHRSTLSESSALPGSLGIPTRHCFLIQDVRQDGSRRGCHMRLPSIFARMS